MPSILVPCPSCGMEFSTEGRLRSVACPMCGVWLHASTCVSCRGSLIALGNGAQVCPRCSTEQPLDDMGIRCFDEVDEPFESAMSRVEAPERTAVGAGAAPARRVAGPGLGGFPNPYQWERVVVWVLGAFALLFLVGGMVAVLEYLSVSHQVRTAIRASVVAAIVLAAGFWCAVSLALAYLLHLVTDVHAVLQVPSQPPSTSGQARVAGDAQPRGT